VSRTTVVLSTDATPGSSRHAPVMHRTGSNNEIRVLTAGGGVAALEALLTLRELAEERISTRLLSPTADFSYRPLAVGEPFGLGRTRRYDLKQICEQHGAELTPGTLVSVDTEGHRVRTSEGSELDYDLLLLAVGGKTKPALEGAVTVAGPGYTSRFSTLLEQLEHHCFHRLTFAVPSGTTWSLPLYELALMTAPRIAKRELPLRDVELRFVTPEQQPLELFGAAASREVAALLDRRGVELLTGLHPVAVEAGELAVVPREAGPIPAERVVSLPTIVGPSIEGVAHDADGFIPIDLHGLVAGESDVYAAGDATSFPIKQGGIASQQADAAAESIAARAGAEVTPAPFQPVLRGMLLTGDTPRYLRAEVGGGRGEDWEVAEHALWWPPSKIAGRRLAPYLGAHHRELARGREAGALPIEVELERQPASGVRRRTVVVPRGDAGNVTAVPLDDAG
jgi:sulfide:quinone oxidoreductase